MHITGERRSVFVVIDVRTGERSFRPKGSGEWLAWSPNGRSIATTNTGPVLVFDAGSGKLRFGAEGHEGFPIAIAWSPDSSFFVSAALDGELKVWDVNEDGATEVGSLSSTESLDGIGGIAVSPEGNRLMMGAADGTTVKIWDLGRRSDAEWARLPASGWVGDIEFLPDGRFVASNDERAVTIWDAETFQPLGTLDSPMSGWRSYDVQLAVSADGRSIASSDIRGNVEVWDVGSRERLVAHDVWREVSGVEWSPDGRLLLMSTFDGSAVVATRTGAEVQTLHDPGFEIRTARFGPDGATIVTSGSTPSGESIWVWDWDRASVIGRFPASADRFAFDPSGGRIATAPPSGGQPEVWDVATGERIMVLTGTSGQVWDVRFSPDGTQLATASHDGTGVRVFDAGTGAPLFSLPGHDLGAWNLAFSPDGSMLASNSVGEIRVGALDFDDLLGIAHEELTRSLTDEECRQYLHVDACVDAESQP